MVNHIISAVLLVFFLKDARCMVAASNGPVKLQNNIRIISTRKNGGHAKTLVLNEEGLRHDDAHTKPSIGISNIVSNARKSAVSVIQSTFLPSGYPSKTPPGYLKYSMFSWAQDLSTQLRSVLATQRVLEGVGVGREGATALSALMNYLVRDGAGMLATLMFTSAASSKFRTDIKRWRLFADLMVDLGITMEVLALAVPRSFFLPMISVGNMCKAVCGVAAGACGGSINLHWAKGSDISDINAKFGAQHTVTGALGLIFAALFARSIDNIDSKILWTLYFSLTLLHVVANVQCMRLIAFDSCNTARMDLLLREFFDWWGEKPGDGRPKLPALSNPESIARKEPLFFGIGQHRVPAGVSIQFGVSFNDLWEKCHVLCANSTKLETTNISDKYIVGSTHKDDILVGLLTDATAEQEAKAYFHAVLFKVELQKVISDDTAMCLNAEARTLQSMELAWNCFRKSAKLAGWDLGKTELATSGYEIAFVG